MLMLSRFFQKPLIIEDYKDDARLKTFFLEYNGWPFHYRDNPIIPVHMRGIGAVPLGHYPPPLPASPLEKII